MENSTEPVRLVRGVPDGQPADFSVARGTSAAIPDGPLLRISSVSRTYVEGEIQVTALRDVNLEIPRQLFSMIVGPSGSGKSTLLNIIGCIDRASGGCVVINGCDISSLNDNKLARFRADHIGFIFQGFNLMPVLSVFENVEYALVLADAPKRERELATEKILRDVQLYEQRHQRPNQLSGGQRQRVAIARALVKRPLLVLADEPTANLDSKTGAAIIRLMREMQRSAKTTFLFSTHDPALMGHADEVFTIQDGRIANHERRRNLEVVA
jgi:putative ABC transport system ATP-binding protein